jgi:hypothetical protein
MPLELMPLINRVARAQLHRAGARSRNVVAHGHEVHFIDMPGQGRGPVVGRRNHYGSRSQRGTEVAALFYSLALASERIPLPHELKAPAEA